MGRAGKPNYNNQKAPGEASYNMVFGQYRYNAKSKNLQFTLSQTSFKEIITQNCYYCGSAPKDFNCYEYRTSQISAVGKLNAWVKINGIDRIDSSQGYIEGNCIPCCTVCNKMKLTYSVQFFIHHVFKIARHMFLHRKFKIIPFLFKEGKNE